MCNHNTVLLNITVWPLLLHIYIKKKKKRIQNIREANDACCVVLIV